MAVIPCSILLLFSVVAVQVGGQFTDGLGTVQIRHLPVDISSETGSDCFISLDCGYGRDAQAYYVGTISGITYVSDAPYIDSGEPHNISVEDASVNLFQRYLTVRSFPSGARNCYTFKSMTPRLKYLIRASFFYGNYDSKNSSSVQFDLHLGVNFWKTITVTSRSNVYFAETIMEATTDLISVCLVNTGRGTPFITSLELRPLNRTLYPVVNASLSLILLSRFDMGRIGGYLRFPSDRHDRIWNPFDDTTSLTKTSTNLPVENPVDDHFEAPLDVMNTAVVPVNSNKLELSLATEPGGLDEYYAVLYFSELKPLLQNESRQFFVYLGGTLLNDAKPFTPDYLSSSAVYSTNPTSAPTHYNISLVSTSDSTFPPILNAGEVFSTMQNTIVPSDSRNGNGDMYVIHCFFMLLVSYVCFVLPYCSIGRCQPPILIGSENIHIVEWVYERLAKGNVEDVVDKSLQGEYDVNCAWKIAYVALNCAMQSSTKRPTMTEVVMQLKERLALQSNLDETKLEDRNTLKRLKEHVEMHQISTFEIECASISDKDGPSAR
nr:PREDICTED: probable LRR receptor-like serine/threonine-protein kinase At1g51860 [Musa acuminata subsp. malaccensis]